MMDRQSSNPEPVETPEFMEDISGMLDNLGMELNFEEALGNFGEVVNNFFASFSQLFSSEAFENLPFVTEDNAEELLATAATFDPEAVSSFEVPEGDNAYMSESINDNENLNGFVGNFESNGNRDAAVVTHADFNPDEPYTVKYMLHGRGGHNPQSTSSFDLALNAQENSDPQQILVYPLSAGGRGHATDDLRWFDNSEETNESFASFHDETLSVIEDRFGGSPSGVQHVTVEYHSAAGQIATHVAESGFAADTVVMLDANYGNWASEALASAKGVNPNVDFQMFVVKNGGTNESDAESIANDEGVSLYYAEEGVGHFEVIQYLSGIDPNSERAQNMLA